MIQVVWDNPEHTIIRVDYYEPIASWGEYRAAVHQAHALARSADYTVHIIHNASTVKMPAQGTQQALDELTMTINDVPPNVALLISVTTAKLEKKISRVAMQILVKADTMQIFMVDSLDTAYQLIHTYTIGDDLAALV